MGGLLGAHSEGSCMCDSMTSMLWSKLAVRDWKPPWTWDQKSFSV